MNVDSYRDLRKAVGLMGSILGETIAEAEGAAVFEKVEKIRQVSKLIKTVDGIDHEPLKEVLGELSDAELLPIARAFSQFLNLANIADQHFSVPGVQTGASPAEEILPGAYQALLQENVPADQISQNIRDLNIELVLTAHPTEITRRSLIHKYSEIDACLSILGKAGITQTEQERTQHRLRELIAQVWHTHEFRPERPTPVDEARWGFAVIENSLWQAVPEFLRNLDTLLEDGGFEPLEVSAAPVRFVSWMGGDRDGNPNVTAKVTTRVLLLARWQASRLFLSDVEELIEELSVSACTPDMLELTNNPREPYRGVLRVLRDRIKQSLSDIEDELQGNVSPTASPLRTEELIEPLSACYTSLMSSGLSIIARGKLLDVLRRAYSFGAHLLKFDIRQESTRHADAIAALTLHLGLGDYRDWDESEKQQFLLTELQSRRPLKPVDWEPDAEVKEVFDSCAVIAKQPAEAIGCYVISMAKQASDILAVQLLLKISGVKINVPVVPLFETLDDLDHSAEIIETLLAHSYYADKIAGALTVMIGYSDSAKDAGMLAAGWAQYRAQEELLAVCDKAGVQLTLFHGRGGTIGRGGAPAHDALLSQPPGSLKGGLRVTEQGEMIRTKLGQPSFALNTLALYTSAILQANLIAPPPPKDDWRQLMDTLSEESCRHYRAHVQGNENFVRYFRQATPEQELARLPLGSRPSRRRSGGGIETLRAIPWIFAWTQNRLMLPAWLGAGQALASVDTSEAKAVLADMLEHWPFFESRLSMLEMVYAKADTDIAAYYDQRLVEESLLEVGISLREQLLKDRDALLALLGKRALLDDQPRSRESIGLRNIYSDPLNLLQVELLKRFRQIEEDSVEAPLMVTIAGIAAGMRNTG